MDDTTLFALAAGAAALAVAGWLLLRKKPAPPPEQLPEQRPEEKAAPSQRIEPRITTTEALPVTQPVAKPALPKPIPAPERTLLRGGLTQTRGGFIAKLGKLFSSRPKIDAALLAQIEEVLFQADIGVKTTNRLLESLRDRLSRDQLSDVATIWTVIRTESARMLAIEAPPLDWRRSQPLVVLMIGVNGVGKTTTIGKLGAQLKANHRSVMFAAGDTFRAAATEQLEIWGQRIGAPVVKGKEGADPSSVIFEAIKRGQAEAMDVLLCDTAGRLHTKTDLMDELEKVRRVSGKACPGAPHETLLVLDATNGQNAIAQAQMFKAKLEVTGIVLTKLDGTAKGGVILGISNELAIPVRYIGIGERSEDLREFDPDAFVDALYEGADPIGA